MHLKKRTYSIDERTLNAFEDAVESGSRSLILSGLMRNYLAESAREKIRAAIIAGAPLVNELYLQESKAWYPLEEEVYEKSNQLAPRRHRSRSPRPSERPRTSRSSTRARPLARDH